LPVIFENGTKLKTIYLVCSWMEHNTMVGKLHAGVRRIQGEQHAPRPTLIQRARTDAVISTASSLLRLSTYRRRLEGRIEFVASLHLNRVVAPHDFAVITSPVLSSNGLRSPIRSVG